LDEPGSTAWFPIIVYGKILVSYVDMIDRIVVYFKEPRAIYWLTF